MKTGFRTLPVESDFARRSANYLASRGCRPGEIRSALVEELDLTDAVADEVLSSIAA